jgi:hypothetical protein
MKHEEQAKKMMDRMRKDMSRLIKKYHAEAAELARERSNPHTPVMGCLQIALCNAAAKHLLEQGVQGGVAFHTITATLNDGQHHWARAILGNQPPEGKRTN